MDEPHVWAFITEKLFYSVRDERLKSFLISSITECDVQFGKATCYQFDWIVKLTGYMIYGERTFTDDDIVNVSL